MAAVNAPPPHNEATAPKNSHNLSLSSEGEAVKPTMRRFDVPPQADVAASKSAEPDRNAIASAKEAPLVKQLAEEQASSGVRDAEALIKRNEFEDAKDRLEKVIHDFPATLGAWDAAKLLEEVNKELTPEAIKKREVEAARKREEAKKLAEEARKYEESRNPDEEEVRRKAEAARQVAEADAARKLKLAKRLFSDAREARLDGKRQEAERLREEGTSALRKVVELYPKTKAAEEAMTLLEK